MLKPAIYTKHDKGTVCILYQRKYHIENKAKLTKDILRFLHTKQLIKNVRYDKSIKYVLKFMDKKNLRYKKMLDYYII